MEKLWHCGQCVGSMPYGQPKIWWPKDGDKCHICGIVFVDKQNRKIKVMTPHLKDIVAILERALVVHQKQKASYIESFMKDATSCLSWGSGIYYSAVACDNITWLLNVLWRHEITKDAEKPAPMVTIVELQAIVMRTLLERANDPMNSTSDGSRAIHKAEIQFWARVSILLQQDPAILDKNFKL